MTKVIWTTGLGWTAVLISAAALVFWSIWGSAEAFHEGWYYRSFWMNFQLTLVQYLSPALTLMIAAAVSLWRPRVGASLHLALALAVAWFAGTRAAILFLATPLAFLGACYWFAGHNSHSTVRLRQIRRDTSGVCRRPMNLYDT